jgi:hypothetical protein
MCLKAYRFFLQGDEESIRSLDISESELAKMKIFHEKLEQGHCSYAIGRTMRIPEFISRGMGLMYDDWLADKPIRDLYPSSLTRPRVAKTYELLLSGMSERCLREKGFSDYEIDKAKLYRKYESCDILPATVSKNLELPVSTVKKLQKVYREHVVTEAMRTEGMRVEMRAVM